MTIINNNNQDVNNQDVKLWYNYFTKIQINACIL